MGPVLSRRGRPADALVEEEEGRALLRPAPPDAPRRPARGVNLGGWLVLERWMNEAAFRGTGARDEFTLGAALGARAAEVLRAHRESWITQQDFLDIRRAGLESVRLPFGFWALAAAGLTPERRRPAAEGLAGAPPYAGPCEGYIWRCLEWAREAGLTVNLCLHGAPGGQSGHDSTGFQDEGWRPHMWDRRLTVACLEHVARVFGGHCSLSAITVLNEPDRQIATADLLLFFEEAYDAIRRHSAVTVVFPIYQRSWFLLRLWYKFPPPRLKDIAFDVHLYHCFGSTTAGLDWSSIGLRRLLTWARSGAGHFPSLWAVASTGHAGLVGEWSLRLPEWDPQWRVAQDLAALPDRGQAYRDFAQGQLVQYRAASAWYFWTWKVDAADANGGQGEPHWDLRECIRRGWLAVDGVQI